jgi:hypothetical protein
MQGSEKPSIGRKRRVISHISSLSKGFVSEEEETI